MMHLMKLNIQIIKKMIKINKQRYFDVFSKYINASWGVLGCLGVSWGNKTDRFNMFNLFGFAAFVDYIHIMKLYFSTCHFHRRSAQWAWFKLKSKPKVNTSNLQMDNKHIWPKIVLFGDSLTQVK